MKVYILSTYEEHGAQDVKATLDRTKVPEILQSWSCADGWADTVARAAAPLAELLAADELVDGAPLGTGWGGFKLYIVELK